MRTRVEHHYPSLCLCDTMSKADVFFRDNLLLYTVDYNVINDCNGWVNVRVSAIKMRTMATFVRLFSSVY